jgi:hypothetical protein
MKLSFRMQRLLLAAGGTLTLAISFAAPAQAAADPSAAQRRAVGEVLTAHNPAAAYNALPASDQALFRASLDKTVGVTTVTEGALTASPKAITAPQATAAASKCWYRYWDTKWSDLGYTEGETWMQLNWCGSGGKITSHSLGVHGGKTLSVGFTYDGVAGTGGFNAGWEYREYVEFKFYVGIGPIHQTLNPCMQIRGGATGKYSEQKTCTLS